MKIYVDFTNGIAFYNDEVHLKEQIPITAREIKADIYEEFLNNQSTKTINPNTLLIEEKIEPIEIAIQRKMQEVLAKEIESYKIQAKFLDKFVFDYTDSTKEAMEKAILSLSQPNAEPLKIMDKATEFNYITLPEVEQIFSQIIQKRTNLHNQCINFLEEIKAGNVDIEIVFKINGD